MRVERAREVIVEGERKSYSWGYAERRQGREVEGERERERNIERRSERKR